MRKHLIIITLAVSCLLSAKAQNVQTLYLKNGSQLHGYMKSQKPGNNCIFCAEFAEVVLDGQKVKKVAGKKVEYDNLPDEWKAYADDNGLMEKKKELTISSIDTGAMINNVLVLEQGRIVKYIELKHDYMLRWKQIGAMEYAQRDELLLSGVNHMLKIKSGDATRTVTGQCIKKIPGALTFILGEDGVIESIETKDIVKDNIVPNNPNQTVFEQSVLLDMVKMKNGDAHTGVIIENNYEENPNCLLIVEKTGEEETSTMLKMSDVVEYAYIPNPDYVEIRDIVLDSGQIQVNRNEALWVQLAEEKGKFIIYPEMERVSLTLEDKGLDVCIEANFKDSTENQDNYLILTRKFANDKKRADLSFFTFRDMIESNVSAYENVTSMNNTTKISFKITSKGLYVFYNSGTKKAVLIEVN